jgi:lysophospholipase L1-like esterase
MKNAPILIVILLYVFPFITQAQKIDRFEKAIIQFEEEDKLNGIQQGTILFTGSSSIKLWKTLKEDMDPMKVVNRGFGGSTIPEVTYYAERIILPYKPEILVIYCGENDLANDETKSSQALKNFKLFSKYMKKNLPETKVFFIAIKPSIRRWRYHGKFEEANEKIEKYISKNENYFFIDTASKMLDENMVVKQDIFIKDNLHMNSKGYDIWTETVKPILAEHYSN